jgi:hypothetical protein
MARPLTFLALMLTLALAPARLSAQNPTLKSAMRDKLVNAGRVLDGLVAGDYAAIGRSADALNRISETEIASWQVGAQPEYRRQAMSFLLSVQALREAAAARDIDAAFKEYTAMVSSCVRCHANVRKSRVISFEPRR